MSFPTYIQLGKTTDLTNELARHFVDTRETTLQILSATGSQIRVQQEGSVQDAALEMDSRHLVATGNGVAWLSFDSTGKHLLVTSWDSKTSNIRILDGKTTGILNMDESPIVRAYFSPSGRYILTLAYNGTMGLWDALSGKNLSTFNQQGVRIVCSAFRPDGQSLVILDANHEIKEWKIPNWD